MQMHHGSTIGLSVLMLVASVCAGGIFYSVNEDWSKVDSLYFSTVITLVTHLLCVCVCVTSLNLFCLLCAGVNVLACVLNYTVLIRKYIYHPS